MNPVQLAVAIVSAVTVAMRSLGLTMEDAAGTTASDVDGAFQQLEARLNAAIQRDREEAADFWTKFLQGLESPFDYFNHRRQFEQKGEALIERATHGVNRVRDEVAGIASRAAVPASLQAAAREWKTKVPLVTASENAIGRLNTLPGWQGQSAGEYGRTSVVQASATSELGGVTQAVSEALSAVASLNEASFKLAVNLLNAAKDQIPQHAASGGYYYTRSARAATVLDGLAMDLSRINDATVIAPAVDELNAQADATIQAPALLDPGAWPTGGSAAGVPPVDPNNITPPDSLPDAEPDGGRSRGTPGVRR